MRTKYSLFTHAKCIKKIHVLYMVVHCWHILSSCSKFLSIGSFLYCGGGIYVCDGGAPSTIIYKKKNLGECILSAALTKWTPFFLARGDIKTSLTQYLIDLMKWEFLYNSTDFCDENKELKNDDMKDLFQSVKYHLKKEKQKDNRNEDKKKNCFPYCFFYLFILLEVKICRTLLNRIIVSAQDFKFSSQVQFAGVS